MHLGLNLQRWDLQTEHNLRLAKKAEKLGYTCVWTEEAYGNDAVVPLAWTAARTSSIHVGAAILQIPARTPAMAAMTGATLDKMSGGRFRMGIGVSGPQVVEGWHGVAYEKPLARTREYVEIIRRILAREGPVDFQGECYTLPYPSGTGQGKPLKLIMHPLRADLPIYLGALGPKNVQLTAEISDGWLPIFMDPTRLDEVFGADLAEGFSRSGTTKAPGEGFDVSPVVPVVVGDEVGECFNSLRPQIALYVGGMGPKKKNFSNLLIGRFGFEEAADVVQKHFLEGQKDAAIAAVPDQLIDAISLCGPRERIKDQLDRWKESMVTTIVCDTSDPEALRVMAELVL